MLTLLCVFTGHKKYLYAFTIDDVLSHDYNEDEGYMLARDKRGRKHIKTVI